MRYVLPFRQGGSVPALVEADDQGMYVVKLRGAAQGATALVAELIAGEIARALGLRVPELVLVELARELAESEPDPELCAPLERSAGLNLGLDYLPGSITFDPVAGARPDAGLASRIVFFDAFVTNVDRTARNANLLVWHKDLWLIDHGASLYFHHGWQPSDRTEGSGDPFVEIESHVLIRQAKTLGAAATELERVVTDALITRIVAALPSAWLAELNGGDAEELRAGYATWLRARREAIPRILEEAERAHAARL